MPPDQHPADDAPASRARPTRCLICDQDFDESDLGQVLFHNAVGHTPTTDAPPKD